MYYSVNFYLSQFIAYSKNLIHVGQKLRGTIELRKRFKRMDLLKFSSQKSPFTEKVLVISHKIEIK